MSSRKNDIERYLRGEMTAAEMHALEKEALRDPFLAEALEGIDQAGHDKFLFDLNELHQSVHQRTKQRRGRVISITRWSYGIAAGLVLLAASSVYIISLIQQKQSRPEALASKNSQAGADTIRVDDSTKNSGDFLSYAEKKDDTQPVGPVQSKPTEATEQSGDEEEQTTPLSAVAQEETIDREAERVVTADLMEYPPVADSISDSQKIAAGLASPSKQETISGRAYGVTASNLVRGKVTSAEDGTPVPGVNVILKGTSIGTVTDDNGNYEVLVNNPNETLVFSFIGLHSLEAKIADKKEVNVRLTADASQLSEVVVTALGESEGSDPNPYNHLTLQFAEPEGGREAFRQYLTEKMIYPEDAKNKKVEGRVTAQFSVDEFGNLGEYKIIRGIGHGCDEELIRLIKEGPKWSPSKRGDQPYKDRVRVRLRFTLAR